MRIPLLLFYYIAAAFTFLQAQQLNVGKFHYISPVPGSRLVSPQNNIVIRFGKKLSSFIPGNVLSVRDSKGSFYNGDIKLSDDGETLIFKPEKNFTQGEKISVVLSKGLKTSSGDELPPLKFSFYTSKILAGVFKNISEKASLDFTNNLLHGKKIIRAEETNESDSAVDSLPGNFPELTINFSNNPERGSIFLSSFVLPGFLPSYLIILNNSGIPTFVRNMPNICADFKLQSNGLLTYWIRGAFKFYAMNDHYEIVDSFATGNGYETDLHELQVLPNGHSLLMAYNTQEIDMSTIVAGGDTAALVIGLIVQELDSSKDVVFQWRSWDHFQITDGDISPLVDLTAHVIDYVHGNAIDMDLDGNILISSRHLSEITKIDRNTGDIIWRLGGKNNQFTFVNDNRGFSHQHYVRRRPNGNLSIFDNGNFLSPEYSRAIEYQIDEQSFTATLVYEYRNNPDVYASFMGDVQMLPSGGRMVTWAGNPSPVLTEIHNDDSKALELSLPQGTYTYRAFRFNWKTALFNVSPDSVFFGTTAFGDSVNLNFTLNNNSDEVLAITEFYNNDGSFKVFNETPFEIPAQSSRQFTVMFKPDKYGDILDTLHVRSDLDSQRIAYEVLLSGTTDSTTSVEEHNLSLVNYRLFQNYPNPFNPTTKIRYSIPDQASVGNKGFRSVQLKIYDILGKEVATIVNEVQLPGHYELEFNGDNLTNGIYLYRLKAGNFADVKKMILLK